MAGFYIWEQHSPNLQIYTKICIIFITIYIWRKFIHFVKEQQLIENLHFDFYFQENNINFCGNVAGLSDYKLL